MKKIGLILLLASLFSFVAGAQKHNEFEIGVGYAPASLVSADDGLSNDFNLEAFLEWRHALTRHFDIGVRLDYMNGPGKTIDYISNEEYRGMLHHVAVFGVADFNLFPSSSINPFIGIGLGPAVNILNWKSINLFKGGESSGKLDALSPQSLFALCASPRVGVELFGHLRLAASFNMDFPSLGNVPACVSLGLTF